MTEARTEIERIDIPAPDTAHGTLHLVRVRGGAQPVLSLHGSSFPSSLCYTVPFDGWSWLDHLAAAGFDAWALDFRGYGRSWMPDDGSTTVSDTQQAARDTESALTHIANATGQKPDVFGWSWGAAVAGLVASTGGDLRRLVLHAAQWLRDTPSPMVTPEALHENYRTVKNSALLNALSDIAGASYVADLRRALDAAPLVVPTGSVRDIAADWMSGRPSYDPSRITCPTLVVTGEADTGTPPAMGREVFDRLASPTKRFEIVPNGGHFAIFQPARYEVARTVAAFLSSQPEN